MNILLKICTQCTLCTFNSILGGVGGMFMQAVLNATEVRANFGGFIDNVVHQRPQAIKRNRDDIVADGETLEELRIELAHHLVEYAVDYYADFNRYYNSTNCRSHANYILRVLLEDDPGIVLGMLHA